MIFRNIAHWLIFLLLIMIVATAVMNMTFFSKESIINTFDFSFPMVDLLEVGYADKLFIARIIRRFAWVWHFWTGVAFSSVIVLLLFHKFVYKAKSRAISSVTYFFTFLMLLSGLPLFLRTYYQIDIQIQDICRVVHFYSSLLFGLVIVVHIFIVIKKENTKEEGVISSMFKFKKNILILSFIMICATAPLQLKSSDKYFNEAKEYLTGRAGVKITRLVLPNCPYDNCIRAEKQNMNEHVDIDKNTREYKIKKKDYKQALKLIEKSVLEFNNLDAAKEGSKLLIKNINYKDQRVDDFLVKKLLEDYGISANVAISRLIKYIELLSANNKCYGLYKKALFLDKGYLNHKIDKILSKELYAKAIESCEVNKIEYLLSSSRVNKI